MTNNTPASLKLVISNSYGTPNLGDEAILHAMCNHYSKEGHSVTILTNTSKKPERPLPAEINYTRAGIINIANTFFTLFKSDLLLIGGGGIIQSSTSIGNLLFHLSRAWLAKLAHKPFSLIGVGVGPIPHKTGKILTKLTLNMAHSITVRDNESANYLKMIGVNTPISTCPDLAFALPSKISGHNYNDKNNTIRIGISLRPEIGPARKPKDHTHALDLGIKLLDAINIIQHKLGKPVHIYFLSFNDEQDLPIGYELEEKYGTEFNITICNTDITPSERIDLISKLDLTISMRLHCVILSALASTPSIGIPYDNKVKNALDSLEQSDLTLDGNEPKDKISDLLLNVFYEYPKRKNKIHSKTEIFKVAANQAMRDTLESINNNK